MRHLLAMVFVWIAAATVMAEDYEIRMARPVKVGDRTRVSGSIDAKWRYYAAGAKDDEPFNTTHVPAAFDLEVKVLELTKNGMPAKVEVKVRKFNQIGDAVDTELLPAGTTITAHREKGRGVVEVPGVTLPEHIKGMIVNVVEVFPEDAPSEDEIVGTKERKKAGDTWSYNSEAAVKLFAMIGTNVDKKDFAGTCKLIKAATIGGVPCLELGHTLKISNLTPNQGDQPAGMKYLKGTLELTSVFHLPMDPSLGVVGFEATEQSTASLEVTGADGEVHQIRLRADVKRAVQYSPIK